MGTRTYTLRIAQAKTRLQLDYEALLNEEQLSVVEAGDGPVLVLGGPGSGKTRTLIFRMARLLERGIPPEGMLLLTFNNAAARYIMRQVGELVGGSVDVGQLLSGTYHHVTHTLVRQSAQPLGFSPYFMMLDRQDARALMATCIAEVNSSKERRFPRAEVVQDLLSTAINFQRPLEEVLAQERPRLLPIAEEVLAVARRFQQRKQQLHLMDFDDLLGNLKRLLTEYPRVRAQLTEQVHCILVDEYQDASHLQVELVDLLAEKRRNLTVVGDDAQSIYSVQGADFTNIIRFPERYPDCSVYQLTRNYRSTPEVLRLASASISFNKHQFPKQLAPARPSGSKPVLVPTKNADEQAAFIAQRVLELRDEGVSLDAMAVLYRAHSQSMELQLELTRRGIPFRVRAGIPSRARSGAPFLEQAHIKDVLAYLRFAHNPGDELAFKRVVKLVPGVGQATAESLWSAFQSFPPGQPIRERLSHPDILRQVPQRSSEAFNRLNMTLERLTQPDAAGTPGQLIEEVLAGGYGEYLQTEFVAERFREEDIHQLAAYSGRFASLSQFLSEIALVSEFSAEDTFSGEQQYEALTLSTVHQAKGLEWKVVFVIWLAEGHFPRLSASNSPQEEAAAEEERRLFYVAATRARDELALVYPLTTHSQEGRQLNLRPSRFLEELPSGEDAPYDQLILKKQEAPAQARAEGLSLSLSSELVQLARAEAETRERSLTNQVAHWVRLGRAVEVVLDQGQQRNLTRRGEALLSLDDALAHAESPRGQDEMRAHLVASGQVLYSADPERPGGIVRENPDGTRTRGRFEERVFVPEGQAPD